MKKLLPIVAIAIVLSGCVMPSAETIDPESAARRSAVSRDEFRKFASVKSMKVTLGNILSPDSYQLSAERKDGSTNTSYFLEFVSIRTEWAFWKDIYDDQGRQYKVDSTPREVVRGGGIVDAIVVHLDKADIVQMSTQGRRFKVYGQRAQKEFVSSAPIVAGFKTKCDETFR